MNTVSNDEEDTVKALKPEYAILREDLLRRMDLRQQFISNLNDKTDDVIDVLKLEYTTLREEILRRMDLRQQFISMTLTFAAVFLGVGLGTRMVAFIFPPLAALLALAWSQNDFRMRKAAEHIRTRLEPILGLSWEQDTQIRRRESGWRWVIFSHGGIFFFSQVMAIVVGASEFTASLVEIVLVLIDILAMTHVIWLFKRAI